MFSTVLFSFMSVADQSPGDALLTQDIILRVGDDYCGVVLVEAHSVSVLHKDRADRLGHVGVLAGRKLRPLLDDGHATAEVPEGLRHLEADVAPAEHD